MVNVRSPLLASVEYTSPCSGSVAATLTQAEALPRLNSLIVARDGEARQAASNALMMVDASSTPALIAEALNISRAEVHGVVTFYHDFRRKPAGRHVLKLCRAEACQAAGGDAIAERAEQRLGIALGGTAADGSVTLEPVYCLGLCACAPSAILDGRVHGRLDDKRLDALIAKTQR